MDDDDPQSSARHSKRHSFHPYIEEDLRNADIVDIYPWIEAASGAPKERIDEWTSKIGELRWFEDEIIQQSLYEFCEAETEPKRCKPFCKLANRIVFLARGSLSGIPAIDSYPVDSITFLATPRRAVSKIPEHGVLGVDHFLDVTVTHGQAFKNRKIAWVDILHSVKLKRTDLPLAEILADEQKKREAATAQPVSSEVSTISHPCFVLYLLYSVTSYSGNYVTSQGSSKSTTQSCF